MDSRINYIAIEDNPIDMFLLKEYVADFPILFDLGSYSSANEGLQAAILLKPDLVFLDIEIPGMTGIEVLRNIKDKVPVAVFITSHSEFALDGFELSALDYVLKPLTAERFAVTVKRIEEYWEMKQKAISYEVLFEKESLIIKDGHNQVRLPQEDIIYLEAMQDYTKVVTDKKNYLTLTTLSGFLEKLSGNNFLRVHRSYAVAVNRVKELHADKIICGNMEIPIGKTYRLLISQLRLT